MSLHTLAHHLQEAGRGEDKVLVHMTPAEVGGLQSLAKAHGGSLTVNPQTGLPEAGFLSSILPMVAGLALAPMTAGTSLAFLGSPLGAAALVGGGTALATGSLGKGLMAGLGAYSGAGLGAGLSSMGTAAVAPSAGVEAAKQGIMANPVYPTAASAAAPTAAASTTAATNQAILNSPMMTGQLGYGGFNAGQFMGAAPTAVATPLPVPPVVPNVPASTPVYGASEAASLAPQTSTDKLLAGVKRATSGLDGLKTLSAEAEKAAPYSKIAGLGSTVLGNYYDQMDAQKKAAEDAANASKGMIRPYDFAYNPTNVASQPYTGSAERMHFNPVFTAKTPYEAPGPEYAAKGGVMGLAVGGPVEVMSAANAVGGNMAYPQSQLQTPDYSNPMMQRPVAGNIIAPTADAGVDAYSGEPRFAGGGLSDLGGYSDGGRLLKGPGDGVSDSIPAVIGGKQPARLADGEFVIPARIVSELGNGSTEAGAKRLYAMMDRVQKARGKTVGKDRVATDTNAEKHLPA